MRPTQNYSSSLKIFVGFCRTNVRILIKWRIRPFLRFMAFGDGYLCDKPKRKLSDELGLGSPLKFYRRVFRIFHSIPTIPPRN